MTKKQERWHVKGDHPIGGRPDKMFIGPQGHAEKAAREYASDLERSGFENVVVEKMED